MKSSIPESTMESTPPREPSGPRGQNKDGKTSRRRDRSLDQLCPYCGAMKMDRQRKEDFVDYLLCIFSGYSYRCRKCLRMATKFFFTFRLVAVVLLLAATCGASAWVVHSLFVLRFGPNGEAASHVEAADGVRANMGQLSPFEKMMLSKHQQTLDNDMIVKLTKSGIGTPIILKMIRDSNHDFDVSANAIIALKNAGVDDSVIFTMLDLSSDPR